MKFTEYLKAMRIVELHEGYIDYERLAASAEEVVLCNLCASATCTHLVAGFNKDRTPKTCWLIPFKETSELFSA